MVKNFFIVFCILLFVAIVVAFSPILFCFLALYLCYKIIERIILTFQKNKIKKVGQWQVY
jgi:hypothetical protein